MLGIHGGPQWAPKTARKWVKTLKGENVIEWKWNKMEYNFFYNIHCETSYPAKT